VESLNVNISKHSVTRTKGSHRKSGSFILQVYELECLRIRLRACSKIGPLGHLDQITEFVFWLIYSAIHTLHGSDVFGVILTFFDIG
jgi:hypothetical protein